MVKEGFEVLVEPGAGDGAHILDATYESAGASLAKDLKGAFSSADFVLKVTAPTQSTALGGHEADAIREGGVLIGGMAPHKNVPTVRKLRDRKVSTMAMELVPRISRAQNMDALSSQASIAGYKAVLLLASHLDKYFPLLMTAAGTIQPARIVVMGAGVAGLQAVATIRRLGGIVEVSDIRPTVKEQVESLGGKFIDLPMTETGEGEGGYAKEVTPEFLKKQQEIVKERVLASDGVITTALVPGKPAPKLITEEMVKEMRPGAVIVDLATEQGGNCVLSEKDKNVDKHGVFIIGHSNLPATMPADASVLYARNVLNVLTHLAKGAELKWDLEDEITKGTLLTHEGKVMHEPTQKLLEAS
jgi:NAD(P) transhydrogenase subunit alpha